MISEITEITDNKGWMEMWLLSGAIFLSAKLLAARAITDGSATAFITLWPGFNVADWMRRTAQPMPLLHRAALNLLLGCTLTWGIAPVMPSRFSGTWVAMIGFVILLHGSLFTAITSWWRLRGRDVRPLMNCPAAAASIGEFWGRRWNAGFRDLAYRLIFLPALRRWNKRTAMTLVFLASGLVHELVITVPARGGYGGPTIYFVVQAVGIALEHRCTQPRLGLLWRLRALVFLIGPLPLLFPPSFIERVMAPFFTCLHALP